MITCRDLVEFIARFFADELSEPERLAFDAHLAVCPMCVTYLRTYEQTMALARGAFADEAAPVPPEVPEDLVQAVLAARSRREG